MARSQSRRSISVRGTTYNQLREYCSGANISLSDFLEQRIADFFTANRVTFTSPGTTYVPPARPVPKPAPRPIAAPKAPAVPRPVAAPRPAPPQSPVRTAPAPAHVPAPTPAPQASGVGRPAPRPVASVKPSGDVRDHRSIRF